MYVALHTWGDVAGLLQLHGVFATWPGIAERGFTYGGRTLLVSCKAWHDKRPGECILQIIEFSWLTTKQREANISNVRTLGSRIWEASKQPYLQPIILAVVYDSKACLSPKQGLMLSFVSLAVCLLCCCIVQLDFFSSRCIS